MHTPSLTPCSLLQASTRRSRSASTACRATASRAHSESNTRTRRPLSA